MSADTFKILLDQPSKKPALGFDNYARSLADLIESSDAQFAIGIFGGWGSGKTTLMQAIRDSLDKNKSIVADFSAWRYEKEKHLIVPLLDVIREALVEWAEAHPQRDATARKTATTVGKVIASLLAGISLEFEIPNALTLSYDANKALGKAEGYDAETAAAQVPRSFYHAGFQALKKAFGEFTKINEAGRIVVFVDDLDRCLPEGALDVLESMKLFFDLPGFVFVVGLDRAVVEWSIESKYRVKTGANAGQATIPGEFQIRGADYIKKIFQVPITLDPVPVSELEGFLRRTLDEAKISKIQRDDIFKTVLPHLNYIVSINGVNPREVKRYVNAYTLMRLRPKPNTQVALVLQTIAFQPEWQSVQRMVFAYQEILIEALLRYMGGATDALDVIDSSFGTIPSSFFKYVENGEPGHVLLTVPNIKEYIFSGEVTRTTQNPQLLDVIRTLAQLKTTLKSIVRNDALDLAAATTFNSEISDVISRVTSASTDGRRAAGITDVLGVLNTLHGNVLAVNNPNLTAMTPDRTREWYGAQERLLQQALSSLLNFFQFSSV